MSRNDENIPLDQMMRKLKSSSMHKHPGVPEEGERVIREDGSVAIKVRTKKRRSVQPKKTTEKKSNKGKLIFLYVMISLVLISVITYFILLGYFNGSRFKSQVSQTIINISGAEVELGNLEVSPTSAKLSTIDLKWSGEDALLKSLKLSKINASFGALAFAGGSWGESTVGIAQADLVIEAGQNNPRLNLSPERPVDFKFNLYQCANLNIDFGEDSLWSFKSGSVSYRDSDKHDQLNINSGDFTVPKFGKFKVQTGILGLATNEAQLFLDLKSDEHQGGIYLDGTVGYTESSLLDLKIELSNYPLKEWIDPRARRFFSGKILTSKGALKMNLGEMESLDIHAEITSKMISITDFEFIKTISEHIQEDYYLRPAFMNESKISIKWVNNKIEFSDIDLVQNDQMRIKGNFTIHETDQLSGTFKIGIPITVISRNRGSVIKNVFNEEDGEYLWTTLIISGDVANPKDNLSEIIQGNFSQDPTIKLDEGTSLEQKFKELTE